jgi:hypothetical protein
VCFITGITKQERPVVITGASTPQVVVASPSQHSLSAFVHVRASEITNAPVM